VVPVGDDERDFRSERAANQQHGGKQVSFAFSKISIEYKVQRWAELKRSAGT